MTTLFARNPRTGVHDYAFEPPSRDELLKICAHLRQHQPGWAEMGVQARAAVLQQWKSELEQRREALISAIATDTGRWAESELEFTSIMGTIDRWCRTAPALLDTPDEKPVSIPFVTLKNEIVPYALVGVISPWNFPLILSLIDAIPALMAGCAVLVKPSEITPRFVVVLLQAIEAVPLLREVFRFVQGAGDTGAAIIEQVDVLCFTGSVATGRKVGEQCAKRFIPSFLELGGKDPVIVLESANLDRATASILWGSMVNNGHSCMSIERVYVARPIFDDFVQMLSNKAQKLTLNLDDMRQGQIGPIIAEPQIAIIRAHLQDAFAKGAVATAGGALIERGGTWCQPTVLIHCNHHMQVIADETFGPIAPVMPFDTLDEAIQLANDTRYGLSAAVFAGDVETARAVGKRIRAGAISLNDTCLTAILHEGEKQSFGFSGLGGSRMGPVAIKRFFRVQAMYANRLDGNVPWWFK
jgi:acyl-CoA reductase-like NAD-dependent aldehyde dehydrogenase